MFQLPSASQARLHCACTDHLAALLFSFLGLLHMEVFLQRLEQEHGASVITTAPTVPYALDLYGEQRLEIQNPSQVGSRTRLPCAAGRMLCCIQ